MAVNTSIVSKNDDFVIMVSGPLTTEMDLSVIGESAAILRSASLALN